MSDGLGARTRRDVEDRIDALREQYGPFDVERETVENDPEFFAHGVELAREGWRGDAGAFVTDDRNRALFVRHADAAETWGLPGGGHEPGESFAETARREVREETGADADLTGVFRVRVRTIVHRDDTDRTLTMLTVNFDARATGDPRIDVGDDEILEARWVDPADPPTRVYADFRPRVDRWAACVDDASEEMR